MGFELLFSKHYQETLEMLRPLVDAMQKVMNLHQELKNE